MIKRRYIKRMYIEEAYCDKCGSPMLPTGAVLLTYPEQFPYHCTNPDCNWTTRFYGDERPGTIKYEFEDKADEV